MENPSTDGYPAFLITQHAAGFSGYGMGTGPPWPPGAASGYPTGSSPGPKAESGNVQQTLARPSIGSNLAGA